MLTYHECIQKLFTARVSKGSKLTLEAISQLLNALGNPHHKVPVVHVAGTNGKGSVSTKIAKGLEYTHKHVGLYTSPHIATFRERIRINGKMISQESVTAYLEKLFPLSDDASFFEITTALMFYYFEQSLVDVAVLETGLGGRLDATNMCQPILTVITSISLDHTQFLGTTIEEIAAEKAGIIKPNVPVLIGPQVPYDVIHSFAVKQNSQVIQVQGDFHHFEEENRAIAKCALQRLGVLQESPLEEVPPCRFEQYTVNDKKVILDVAHNEDGICKLFERLQRVYPSSNVCAIYGASKDKDVASCLRTLLPLTSLVFFVEANTERRMLQEELLELVPAAEKPKCLALQTMEDTVSAALQSDCDTVVIFGTFFIMAPIRRCLGIQEEGDPIPIIEKMI